VAVSRHRPWPPANIDRSSIDDDDLASSRFHNPPSVESEREMGCVGQLVYGVVLVAVAGAFFLALHLYLAPLLYLLTSATSC